MVSFETLSVYFRLFQKCCLPTVTKETCFMGKPSHVASYWRRGTDPRPIAGVFFAARSFVNYHDLGSFVGGPFDPTSSLFQLLWMTTGWVGWQFL